MFRDRTDAGRRLAQAIGRPRWGPSVVVALPRGGVPVALPVARALHAPLDLLLVRKVGALGDAELAVGAVAEGDPPVVIVDQESLGWTGESEAEVRRRAAGELAEIERRRAVYLAGRARPPVTARTVVLVDDGLATGTTARAAIAALREREPARLVLAVPVGAADTVEALRGLVDQLVCLEQPAPFHGVGAHYEDFRQVDDAEVVAALASLPAPEEARP